MSILGIIIATIVGMVLGALWYSPMLFGKQWMESIGKTPETMGSQTVPMVGSVIASFLSALGVAILFAFMNVNDFLTAMFVGLTLGLFIVFPALLSDNLFCGWGRQLLFIQSGYRVVQMLLMSIAMCFF